MKNNKKNNGKIVRVQKVRDSRKKQSNPIKRGEGKMAMETLGMDVKTDFDPKNVGKDILRFMKSSFDATFDNAAKIQDLNERMLKNVIEVGKEMQADAVKMVDVLSENAKKGRDEYRKVLEEGLKRVEEIYT